MASQRCLVRLLLLCLLCGAALAAKRRYLTVTMDELLSYKAHVDCPPTKKSVTTSGNKLTTTPLVCGLPDPNPPKCCGAGESFGRHVLNHDINRLSTLLQRSSSAVSTAPAPSAGAIPWIPSAPAPSPVVPGIPIPFPPMMPPAPLPVPGFPFPPVAPPAEAPAVTIPDSSGEYLDTLEFVVTVGFGTPARTSTLLFDTGSDVSWIQCQPCSSGHCYPQHDPIFDPTKSATYAAVPCGHPQCKAAGGRCDSNGTCLYEVEYGDGSSSSGVLSHDTLTLTSSRTLPGFAFGCGERNLGDFGSVDGLIGLGRSPLSLSSQAAASLGATFSYCLPSHNNSHGYLTIGSTPVSETVVYTAMVQKQEYPSFYFVELVSIDIGGFVLPVPPTVFTSTGTLLDSGTVLTYLPPEAYTALRDRFRFTMKQYKPAPAYDVLDTCYDFTGQSALFIPAVSFKFSDGSVFDLDFFGIMIFPDDETAIGCLAFVARPSMMPFTIVGNTQQRNTEVIYDVAAEKIGFVSASC
ncbi:hypothetical protein BS78_10G128100 [Paspalum vaginatum]|nr:hypothetical protein BS78_10G128100 [Paspalum vaginatum]